MPPRIAVLGTGPPPQFAEGFPPSGRVTPSRAPGVDPVAPQVIAEAGEDRVAAAIGMVLAVCIGAALCVRERFHIRIMTIMPQWAPEGGVSAVLSRLEASETRERIEADRCPMWRLVLDDGWDRIVPIQSEANPDLVGPTFDEIGRRRGVDLCDVSLDLLIERATRWPF